MASISNLLLKFLNLTLFILSLVSLSPIIILKTPPAFLGLISIVVSSLSILAAFLGFFSLSHFSFLFASSIIQLVAFSFLFFKEKTSISLFKSVRDTRETKLLVRVQCGLFLCLFVLHVCVALMMWVVKSCSVREGKKEAVEKKKGNRLSRIFEESMENVEKSKEAKDKEFDEKMKKKYGQWVKTDLEV